MVPDNRVSSLLVNYLITSLLYSLTVILPLFCFHSLFVLVYPVHSNKCGRTMVDVFLPSIVFFTLKIL